MKWTVVAFTPGWKADAHTFDTCAEARACIEGIDLACEVIGADGCLGFMVSGTLHAEVMADHAYEADHEAINDAIALAAKGA